MVVMKANKERAITSQSQLQAGIVEACAAAGVELQRITKQHTLETSALRSELESEQRANLELRSTIRNRADTASQRQSQLASMKEAHKAEVETLRIQVENERKAKIELIESSRSASKIAIAHVAALEESHTEELEELRMQLQQERSRTPQQAHRGVDDQAAEEVDIYPLCSVPPLIISRGFVG